MDSGSLFCKLKFSEEKNEQASVEGVSSTKTTDEKELPDCGELEWCSSRAKLSWAIFRMTVKEA